MLKKQLFDAAHWGKVKGSFIQRLWQWDFCNEEARLGSAPSTAWANRLSIATGQNDGVMAVKCLRDCIRSKKDLVGKTDQTGF